MSDKRIAVIEAALEKIMFLKSCGGDCRAETCPAGIAQVALGREPKTKDPCCDHYNLEKKTVALEAEVVRLRELCEKARKYVTGYAAGSEKNLKWFVYRKALNGE